MVSACSYRLQNGFKEGDPTIDGHSWPRIGLLECIEQLQQQPLWAQRTAQKDNLKGWKIGIGVAVGGWPGGLEPAAAACRLDIAILRLTYDTNVFGVFAVTKAMLPLLWKAEAGRIVNMSSGAGLPVLTSSPECRPEWNTLAYNSSKSAVNAITVQFANELRSTPIKVNAVNPGYVATDLNRHRGDLSVQQGASAPVQLATLPADSPTGAFFDENGIVPW
jgi:NAD(P)-dependent dehydrogenase (short-subunit alcohol dehydrogenase family)